MLRIYDSMEKRVVDFVPLRQGVVGMYACGPTVYGYTHIGHGRKYVTDDILRRVLETIEGYKVTHVQNVTDVGHLVSDGDEGEDKLEKKARDENMDVWQVAKMYTEFFNMTMAKLNVKSPSVVCKATEHVDDQIKLIERIIANGHGYDTPEAVYFDVNSFPNYGKLFNQSLEEKEIGVRDEVEQGQHKKHPADFVLWFKRVGRFANHVMHWNSPWGDGFPGWHIECSAMSMKYLGEQFDIHTGGEDHLSIHHPNEIAQSESATGKPFVRYWLHTTFLMVDGKKMSKSLGNLYRLEDLAEKGFSPMALRYYFLTTHYRKQMNFTWDGLAAASAALEKLLRVYARLSEVDPVEFLSLTEEGERLWKKFADAIENDLNTSLALATVWEMVKSDLGDSEKRVLAEKMNEVLGLGITMDRGEKNDDEVPMDIVELLKKRDEARKYKDYTESDKIRDQITGLGYSVFDTPSGSRAKKV